MDNRETNNRKRKQIAPQPGNLASVIKTTAGSSELRTINNIQLRNLAHQQQYLGATEPTNDERAAQLQRHYAKYKRRERRDILNSKRDARRNEPIANNQDSSGQQPGVAQPRQQQRTTAQEKYSTDVSYYGMAPYECKYCHAVFWGQERIKKASSSTYPIFGLCCKNGKIALPRRRVPPEPLRSLLDPEGHVHSLKFLENIRAYNSMLSMTSTGARVDNSINGQGTPYIYRIGGDNYHRMGSLLPVEGKQPSFLQLYIYDTANEVTNRIRAINQREHNGELSDGVVRALIAMLDTHNELVKAFRIARERYVQYGSHDFSLRLIRDRPNQGRQYSPPTSSEIAMLVLSDFNSSSSERDLIIESRHGHLKRVNDLHPTFMALQYPLLFPFGEDGFHPEIPYVNNRGDKRTKREFLTAREYYSYMCQYRRTEGQTLQQAGRLYQQYIVDAYTQIEQQRLRWIRQNQGALRTDLYRNVCDAFQRGDANATDVGMRTILPSSFTGGPRYMVQNYQDAMAICREFGNPDYFITFTANPKWQEITDMLSEVKGQKPENRPDVESRVFKMKLEEMMHDIIDNEIFGKVEAVIYTIEFQKRGLPHAHIIFWVHPDNKLQTTEQVDSVISAEIPDPLVDPVGHAAVTQFMMHGPCGDANKLSPCMKNGICSKSFPKPYRNVTSIDESGFCTYRRRDTGLFVEKKEFKLDNRHVAAYNRYLIVKYNSHINVEACNKSKAIKYLFKYVTKGTDKATVVIESRAQYPGNVDDNVPTKEDEIKKFLDCRYISACEAIWRIYEFDIHYRRPSVEHLSYHLKDEQLIFFNDDQPVRRVLENEKITRTMFTEWFEINKVDPEARLLTYVQFPKSYVWQRDSLRWKKRKSGRAIGRMTYAHPASGERYYLRLLLNVVKGPTSYEAIRTFEDVLYPTMKAACYARGILAEDNQWNKAIDEASTWSTGPALRDLFLTILLFCDVSDVKQFWETNWQKLSEGILQMRRRIHKCPLLIVDEPDLKNYTLGELEKAMLKNGRSLADIDGMPLPNKQILKQLENTMIVEEQNYSVEELRESHVAALPLLNDEQRAVYDQVIETINDKRSGLFFLYGFGGTGKTFLYTTILNKLRSEAHIALAVASSGIAALLLPGGRTAHSRFRIPINLTKNSTCTIKQKTQLAELIQLASLIIWDEAPMDSKHAFEAVDRTLKDILRGCPGYDKDLPFGGKCVLLGGDFRQILPVIPGGGRGEIVSESLNSSYLWSDCQVHFLTQNMRVQKQSPIEGQTAMTSAEFSDWILRIGNGTEYARAREEGGEPEWVMIPDSLLLQPGQDPLQTIFESTYPQFQQFKFDEHYLTNRAILTPKNATVDFINDLIMGMVNSQERFYTSYDSIEKSAGTVVDEDILYPSEFLNSLSFPGLPEHKLHLKVGVPIMLLRNLNPSKGLCNGTRLIVTQLSKRVVEGRILSGSRIGEKVNIPRIVLSSADKNLPFVLKRCQFPIRVSYAMTINKSQGQTLGHVGLYLPHPVFSHGQLYVALSRVKTPNGLRILLLEDDEDFKRWTKNVVYNEVFNNLMC